MTEPKSVGEADLCEICLNLFCPVPREGVKGVD